MKWVEGHVITSLSWAGRAHQALGIGAAGYDDGFWRHDRRQLPVLQPPQHVFHPITCHQEKTVG